MLEDRGAPIPFRLQANVYGVAFFAGSQFLLISVIMPLWALELGASPFFIGLIISSRQILVITLSIHGGTLLDRFGPRLVIMCLGFAGAGLTLLFPLLPFLWACIVLQMATGFAEVTCWIGAQALTGGLLRGRPDYAGRMTAASRIGGFCGPILVGMTWEILGTFAAFAFVAAWVASFALVAWFLPETDHSSTRVQEETRRRSVLPSLSDYATTFRLLVLPAVALVIATTFMRQAGSGIQSSFYVVWIKEIGFTASTIGLLIGISNAAAAIAALTTGALTRRFAADLLLIVMTILSVAAIAITPMLGSLIALSIAIGFRGVGQGLNLPLMLSIASQAVGSHLQGRVAALRLSFNKFGGAIVPFVMGAIAEMAGLEWSFYIVGIVGVGSLTLLGLWVAFNARQKRRQP
ncbi:MAG: MFS transporter [Alphaproteobacteria bacterium]|nr:MFS transporter [Alphaproteobacteria bacterium]